jgi:hypothetical protein
MKPLETTGLQNRCPVPDLLVLIDRLLEDPGLTPVQRETLLEERDDVALSHVMASILDDHEGRDSLSSASAGTGSPFD